MGIKLLNAPSALNSGFAAIKFASRALNHLTMKQPTYKVEVA